MSPGNSVQRSPSPPWCLPEDPLGKASLPGSLHSLSICQPGRISCHPRKPGRCRQSYRGTPKPGTSRLEKKKRRGESAERKQQGRENLGYFIHLFIHFLFPISNPPLSQNPPAASRAQTPRNHLQIRVFCVLFTEGHGGPRTVSPFAKPHPMPHLAFASSCTPACA